MDRIAKKISARAGRKVHIRKKISGTADRPRLCVSKSNLRLYVQVINDVDGTTIASASTLEPSLKSLGPNIIGGEKLGEVMGQRLKEKGVTTVVFDRNGYKYHGVVKAIADAARKTGLEF